MIMIIIICIIHVRVVSDCDMRDCALAFISRAAHTHVNIAYYETYDDYRK